MVEKYQPPTDLSLNDLADVVDRLRKAADTYENVMQGMEERGIETIYVKQSSSLKTAIDRLRGHMNWTTQAYHNTPSPRRSKTVHYTAAEAHPSLTSGKKSNSSDKEQS